MQKAVAAAALIVGVWLGIQNRTSAQQPDALPPLSGALSILPTTLNELRSWDTFIQGATRSGELRIRSADRDPTLPSRTVERFQQVHQGVRIWGAEIVRDSERGIPLSIFGMLSDNLTLSVDPSVTLDAASDALLQVAGSEASLLTTPELVILLLDSGDHRLVYTAVVAGAGEVIRAFVDAHTGAELMRYTEIQTQQPAIGTGTGVLGDQKKLSVETSAGEYVTFDRHRPPVIQTFDMRGDLPRTLLVTERGLPLLRSDLATDADNVWADPAVVDAHAHVGWTYDYYFKRFGRAGLDGRNSPINIVTNGLSQQAALGYPPASSIAGTFIRNAFWCGPCNGGTGLMFFGNGIPATYYFPDDGRNYTYLSGALDVVAHELTHAVTQATSQLVYRNESGALNEAFSDMMGKSVEFFYHPPGSGPGQADYVVGKDVARARQSGALNGIRSMANPGLYGDPDHYSIRATGTQDDGGIHTNAGIANQAFYLAIEGGTNRTSGVTVQGVGAANREQIEKVFYRAFTLLMPANATFSTARAATGQAARDLYGAGSAVERSVTQAWTAVGVFDQPPPTLLAFSTSATRGWRSIQVFVSGRSIGTLRRYIESGRESSCDPIPDARLVTTVRAGRISFSARSDTDVTWDGSVQVPEGTCYEVELTCGSRGDCSRLVSPSSAMDENRTNLSFERPSFRLTSPFGLVMPTISPNGSGQLAESRNYGEVP